MKVIFIFPPVWSKKSPSTGISSISGYLKSFGYSSQILDLNIDFYNEFLNDEKYNQIYEYINALSFSDSLSKNEISIINIFNKNKNLYSRIKNRINESVKVVKTDLFYDSNKYKVASFVISKAIELISLINYPYIIFNEHIENIEHELKYEDYKQEALNNKNIFYDFLYKKSEEITKQEPKYVGISINFEGQMLAGLTIANILKTKYKINIVLGGTHITRLMENIKKDDDIFKNYANFIMIGEGEIPTLKLLQMLDGKCSIEQVPSIIYRDGYTIKSTPLLSEQISIDFSQDFNYTSDKTYFLPEKVFPINISKGCYWGKCKFCDFSLQYTNKPIDRVIKEIKTLKKLYDAKYFYLTDAALAPKTAKEFAMRLLQEKLNIRYTTFLRFEKVYDKKFLKLLYNSGLRCVSWGLESGSQKVLNLMNKGTDIKIIQRILKDTKKLGIANRLTVIYLFPGETFSDFCDTIKFLKNNKNNIFYVTFHRYVLKRYSYVFDHQDEFGIKLTTDIVKPEYPTYELGISYDQNKYDKKLQEITSIKGGVYQQPDETLLYYSYFEKRQNKLLRLFYD